MPDLYGRFVLVDAEDFQPAVLEFIVQALQAGHGHSARATPSGPEIQQHDLSPAIRNQANRPFGQITRRKIRRRITELEITQLPLRSTSLPMVQANFYLELDVRAYCCKEHPYRDPNDFGQPHALLDWLPD